VRLSSGALLVCAPKPEVARAHDSGIGCVGSARGIGQPELVGDQAPVRVELVVAHAVGHEVEAELVDMAISPASVARTAVRVRPTSSALSLPPRPSVASHSGSHSRTKKPTATTTPAPSRMMSIGLRVEATSTPSALVDACVELSITGGIVTCDECHDPVRHDDAHTALILHEGEKRRTPVADDEPGAGLWHKETAANAGQDAHFVGEAVPARILLRVKCSTSLSDVGERRELPAKRAVP
jgi:hypothetical protein